MDLLDLQRQFEQMASAGVQRQFYEKCTKEVGARFLGKVIRKTPVGQTLYAQEATGEFYKSGKNKGKPKTKRVTARMGGTLRRGWTAKTHREAESGGGGTDPLQHVEKLPVNQSGNTFSVIVSNCVEYASFVESGHRQQVGRYVPAIGRRLKRNWVDGQFFMAKSEAEIKTEIPAVLQRRLDDFLRRGGL